MIYLLVVLGLIILAQAVVLHAAFCEIRRLENINIVDWRWIIKQINMGRVGNDMPDHPGHLCRPAGFWGFMLQ